MGDQQTNENPLHKRIKAYLEHQRECKSYCTDPKGIEVRKYVYESIDQIYFFGQKVNRDEIERYRWE